MLSVRCKRASAKALESKSLDTAVRYFGGSSVPLGRIRKVTFEHK